MLLRPTVNLSVVEAPTVDINRPRNLFSGAFNPVVRNMLQGLAHPHGEGGVHWNIEPESLNYRTYVAGLRESGRASTHENQSGHTTASMNHFGNRWL